MSNINKKYMLEFQVTDMQKDQRLTSCQIERRNAEWTNIDQLINQPVN